MTKKLIITGAAVLGTAALIAGITVPTVLVNQGNGNNSQPSKPDDAQKIKELKEKFEKGLNEASSKITDSSKFAEYYEALKKELKVEKESGSGVKYVLSELKLDKSESDIASNSKITIKYELTSGSIKDSLTFEFKNPSFLSDSEKISELKNRFQQGLNEANGKITDSSKFVEYYNALKSELNSEKTGSYGIKYVLSEVKVADESNIAGNDKITIKYNFTLGSTTDSLTFEFKNNKQDNDNNNNNNNNNNNTTTDWQRVRKDKEKLLNKITDSYNNKSFEESYNSYLSELNQTQSGENGSTIKLIEFKAEYPKAEKIASNSYFSIKYDVSYNGFNETLEYKFGNKNPIENVKMVQSLTSNKDGFVVNKGVLVNDFRLKDASSKLDDLVIPEFIEEIDSETGVISRAQVVSIGRELYKSRQIRTLKLPSSIKEIKDGAFSYNELSSLDLSSVNNLEIIGVSAFRDNKISTVTFPASLSQIKVGAFLRNQISSLDLSKTKVTIIDKLVFEQNRIKDVKFNLSTTEVREYAFYKNEFTIQNLNASNFSETVINRIEPYAFGHQKEDYKWNIQNPQKPVEDKNKAKLLKLPKTLKLIGSGAFENYQRITFYPYNARSDLHSQFFTIDGDHTEYPKKIKVLNEDGTRADFSDRYFRDFDYVTYFTGRGYFNSSVINGSYYKNN